jgi:hypothetical protein
MPESSMGSKASLSQIDQHHEAPEQMTASTGITYQIKLKASDKF